MEESRIEVASGWREVGNEGLIFNGYRVWVVWKFWRWMVVMVAQYGEYT